MKRMKEERRKVVILTTGPAAGRVLSEREDIRVEEGATL